MSIENAVYADLTSSIVRVRPEVAGNVWETDQVEKIAWENLTIPYSVIVIANFPETDEGSSDTTNYLPTADIYYVEASKGPLNSLRDILSAVKDDLLSSVFPNIEVYGVYDMQYGSSLTANEVFASKRMPHAIGKITARCLISESY